jgi:hypothetical protein
VVVGATSNVDDVVHVEPFKLYDAASLADAVNVVDCPSHIEAALGVSVEIMGRGFTVIVPVAASLVQPLALVAVTL